MALKNLQKTINGDQSKLFTKNYDPVLEMPELEEAEAMILDDCSSAFSDDLLPDDFSQLDLDEPEYGTSIGSEESDEEMEDYYTETYPELVAEAPALEEQKQEAIEIKEKQKESKPMPSRNKENKMTFAERLRAINAQKEVAFKEEIKTEIERIKTEIEALVMEKNIEQYTLNIKNYEPRKKTWILTGLTTEGLVVIPENEDSVVLKWI